MVSTFKLYGFKVSIVDPSLLIKGSIYNGGIIILIYLDDFLVIREPKQVAKAKDIIRKLFNIKDLGLVYYYLGIEIRRNYINRTIIVS